MRRWRKDRSSNEMAFLKVRRDRGGRRLVKEREEGSEREGEGGSKSQRTDPRNWATGRVVSRNKGKKTRAVRDRGRAGLEEKAYTRARAENKN